MNHPKTQRDRELLQTRIDNTLIQQQLGAEAAARVPTPDEQKLASLTAQHDQLHAEVQKRLAHEVGLISARNPGISLAEAHLRASRSLRIS